MIQQFGYAIKLVCSRRLPASHIHVHSVDIDNRPAFNISILFCFLMTFLRFSNPVMDIGIVTSAFYLDCYQISIQGWRQFFPDYNIRICCKLNKYRSP